MEKIILFIFYTIVLFISIYWNKRLMQEIKGHRKVEEELIHAKTKAEASSCTQSAFLAGMSHELRTPLNGILGYARILKEEPDMNKKHLDGLDIIEKNGNHLLSLLNKIFDPAKIESNKIELHETNFSLTNKKIIGIRGKVPKILMVDDNQFNRAVFRALLAPYGFEIMEAGDGREGLERALEFKPDVIITDLVMPEMNGIELIQQVRQFPALKDIIIFASSASILQEDQKNSINAGADSFLSKPIEAKQILEQLQQFLNLEWIYEEIDENAELMEQYPEKTKENPLSTARFQKMPEELLDRLISASKITDPCAAEIIVEQIRELDKIMAEALDELVSEFRFDILLDILDSDKQKKFNHDMGLK